MLQGRDTWAGHRLELPTNPAEVAGNAQNLVNAMRGRISLLLVGLWASPATAHPIGTNPPTSIFCRSPSCVFVNARARIPAEQIIPAQLSPPALADNSTAEGWRLVRTPGPDKNDVVSVMRTADIMRSDVEFAGIMIRCRAKSALQIAFVVITPFRPRSHPKITVGINRSNMYFQAEVIPPGSLVTLPNEAEVLAKGAWLSAKELTVDIESDGEKIHGTVSLENLSGAIAQLQASCPQ